MTDDYSKQAEIEKLCRRIESLASTGCLSEDQKFTFVREVIEIINAKQDEEEF